MPPPEVQRVVEQMAERVAALDAATAARLIDEYAVVYTRLQRDTLRLLNLAKREELKPWQVMRLDRYRQLDAQFIRSMARFSRAAGGIITESQRAAVGLSITGAALTVNTSLPTGITLDNLANIGISWNRLPEEAFQAFVGVSGDGAPLGNLLDKLGPQASTDIKAAIRTGIATGVGPRATADSIRRIAGMDLSRALTISRTETLRAHREATRLNYAANSDIVKGYRRLATKDDRTCMACIALDGTLYENNEPLDAHPNCRCAMVPATLTYEDLGLDIPEEAQPESGQEWFGKQPKFRLPHHDKKQAIQSEMMGSRRFKAFQQGKIKLPDLVSVTSNPTWGKSATVKSVKALGV